MMRVLQSLPPPTSIFSVSNSTGIYITVNNYSLEWCNLTLVYTTCYSLVRGMGFTKYTYSARVHGNIKYLGNILI